MDLAGPAIPVNPEAFADERAEPVSIKELAKEYLKLYPMDVMEGMPLTKELADKIGDGRIYLFAHWAEEKIKQNGKL